VTNEVKVIAISPSRPRTRTADMRIVNDYTDPDGPESPRAGQTLIFVPLKFERLVQRVAEDSFVIPDTIDADWLRNAPDGEERDGWVIGTLATDEDNVPSPPLQSDETGS
jgi:hypothetical protein